MNTIFKNHLAIDKITWRRGILSGHFNTAWRDGLSLEEVPPTYETFKPMLDEVSTKWHWNKQPRYQEPQLRERLAHPETRLFLLKDRGETVGYAITAGVDRTLREKLWKAANDISVIEIENLATFPGQEGKGRGTAYFEMMFKELFKTYDTVYWSMSSSNYPTLLAYYERMGMTLLVQEEIPDFRTAPVIA